MTRAVCAPSAVWVSLATQRMSSLSSMQGSVKSRIGKVRVYQPAEQNAQKQGDLRGPGSYRFQWWEGGDAACCQSRVDPIPCHPIKEQLNAHCPSSQPLICLVRDGQLVHQAPWTDGRSRTLENDLPHPNSHGPSEEDQRGPSHPAVMCRFTFHLEMWWQQRHLLPASDLKRDF